jgi:U11/U12 small nuclear ribonucleoprotein SNRNP48
MPYFYYAFSKVRRDIIDKYMEEIKQAGGIGCFVKGTEDRGMFPSESPSAHDSSTITVDEPRESDYAATRGSQYNDRTQSHSDYSKSSKSWKDASSLKDYEQPSGSLNEHHEYVDLRSFSRDTRDRENYSRSSGRYDSHGRSHVRSCHRREREDLEVTNTRHHEIKQPSSVMLKNHYSRSSSSASNSVNDSSAKKDEQNSKVENRRRRNTYENHRNAFDDRYIPSESHDMYEDDLSPLAACIGPDKLCVRELLDQPCSYSSIRHIPDYHDKSE